MLETYQPADVDQLAALIAWAAAETKPLEILGAGTKRGLGRPVAAEHSVDLGAFTGVSLYEADELVLTAGAATPLKDIDGLLSQTRQQLGFEPADYGRLLGGKAEAQTLGGVLASNLSGSRRIKAGAARDHFLGFKAVTGRGEIIKSGGRVVKNVTGYDLSKLMAGSYGTLAVMSEVTVKVLPAPEKIRTVLAYGLNDADATKALTAAAGSPHEVSGLAHLGAETAVRSAVGYVSGPASAVTAVRVEGPAPSVAHRSDALKQMLGETASVEELHGTNSIMFWREVTDAVDLFDPAHEIVWRLSLTPATAPDVVSQIRNSVDCGVLYDWAGGLVWLTLPASGDADHDVVRRAVAGHGHATLIRAPGPVRAAIPVFQPQATALARLTARVKESFDPAGILNPGRMYSGL